MIRSLYKILCGALFISLGSLGFGETYELPSEEDFSIAIKNPESAELSESPTLEEIKKAAFTSKNQKSEPGQRTVWYRLQLANPSLAEREVLLLIPDAPDYTVFWVKNSQQRGFTQYPPIGKTQPEKNRAILSKDTVFPIKMLADTEATVLFQIDNWYATPADLTIMTRGVYNEFVLREAIFFGLFFGAILVNFLLNALLFVRLRERHLFYFTSYLAAVFTLILATTGYGKELFWGAHFQGLAIPILTIIASFFLLSFTESLLSIKQIFPKLRKHLGFPTQFFGTYLILDICIFGATKASQFATMIFSLAVIITIAVYIAVSAFHGSKSARILAISWGALIIGSSWSLLAGIGFLEVSEATRSSSYIGIFLQLCLIPLAIVERIHSNQDTVNALTKKRNAELEIMIKEKSKAIRYLLDNVQSGFFAVDHSSLVLPGFSTSCAKFIGDSFRVGEKISTAFNLSEPFLTHFELAILQVFDQMLPTKVALAMIPPRIKVQEKTFSLKPSIISKDQKIQSILFTIDDITDLVREEKQLQTDEAVFMAFKQKTAFIRFIENFRLTIEQCQSFAKRGNEEIQLRELLHTLKGNSSLFGLSEVVALIHKTEGDPEITPMQIQAIENSLIRFIDENLSTFGIFYRESTKEYFQIQEYKIDQFLNQLEITTSAEEIITLSRIFCAEAQKRRAIELLGPVETLVQNLADKLGKTVELNVDGGSALLRADRFEPIVRNIQHLVRNALDHGIETGRIRQQMGKPKKGHIKLAIEKRKREILVAIEDDGRGIDPWEIASLALKKGLVTQSGLDAMSDKEVQMLIFNQGMSTANGVSEISGRGFGLSAVMHDIKRVGGQITLHSVPNKGTKISIVVPDP